jgi:hypothetical protein
VIDLGSVFSVKTFSFLFLYKCFVHSHAINSTFWLSSCSLVPKGIEKDLHSRLLGQNTVRYVDVYCLIGTSQYGEDISKLKSLGNKI